jgi:ribosome-associated protein
MTHTRALIEHVDEEMSKLGFEPTWSEGVREGRWAVLDYGDVIVHIFNDESRLFYHLEALWGDDKNTVKY